MDPAAQPQPVSPRRFPGWPLLFCVLPVVIAFALFSLINRREANTPSDSNAPVKGAADLGSRAKPMVAANEERPPENTAENGEPDKTPPPLPGEPEASAREIEIHIKNLKFAVQHNNAKGVALESDWLRKAKPRALVMSGLQAARDAEADSAVRLALFKCIEDDAQALAWARWANGKWPGRFLGTDSQLEPGNIDEFSACARKLFAPSPLPEDALALARNALLTGQPTWLLKVLAEELAWGSGVKAKLEPLWAELGRLLESGGGGDSRDLLFVAWSHHFESVDELLRALGDARMHGCLIALLKQDVIAKKLYSLDDDKKLLAYAEALLGSAGTEAIRADLIAALAATWPNAAEDVRRIIEAGLARRDANLADYLSAFGRLVGGAKDLKRLAEFANDADANVARGAINGLRQAPLKAADDELRAILETGQNSGVKGDALAALIERNPQTRDTLVDEYVAEDKPAALRVIAVSYLSARKLDRLKELGENDPEMRVREAAINKLGALKDNGLKTYFTRISRSDPVPVLRQLAKKYAAELE